MGSRQGFAVSDYLADLDYIPQIVSVNPFILASYGAIIGAVEFSPCALLVLDSYGRGWTIYEDGDGSMIVPSE